jgi:hypothetical protein
MGSLGAKRARRTSAAATSTPFAMRRGQHPARPPSGI